MGCGGPPWSMAMSWTSWSRNSVTPGQGLFHAPVAGTCRSDGDPDGQAMERRCERFPCSTVWSTSGSSLQPAVTIWANRHTAGHDSSNALLSASSDDSALRNPPRCTLRTSNPHRYARTPVSSPIRQTPRPQLYASGTPPWSRARIKWPVAPLRPPGFELSEPLSFRQ